MFCIMSEKKQENYDTEKIDEMDYSAFDYVLAEFVFGNCRRILKNPRTEFC